jgi:hypothetical protein
VHSSNVVSVHACSWAARYPYGPSAQHFPGMRLGRRHTPAPNQVLHCIDAGKLSLNELTEHLTHESYRLQLVCESCGVPQGEGYSVKKPREWVPKMLPAMQVSKPTPATSRSCHMHSRHCI